MKNKQVKDGIFVTLKEHTEALRKADNKRYDERDRAAKEAVSAALLAQKDALVTAVQAANTALTTALASAEKAVAKSEAEVKEWRTNANEWRGTISDRDAKLMSRAEAEQAIDSLTEKIADLRNSLGMNTGRLMGQSSLWGWIFGGIMAIAAIITVVLLLSRSVPQPVVGAPPPVRVEPVQP